MEELIKLLQDDDESERLYAAEDLADLGTTEAAIPLIHRLSKEESVAVKTAIVNSLKRLDCQEVFDQLFELYFSTDAFLRNAAVAVFGSCGDDGVAYLTSKLDHTDQEVRKLVLDALFEIGTPETLLVLRAGLFDESLNVQITAVEYLGRLADEGSTADILRLLAENDEPMLRAAILETLAMVGDSRDIQELLTILIPSGNIMEVDSFYLTPLTDLVSKVGNLDQIIALICDIADIELYGYELVNIISTACKRFGDIFDNEEILAKVKELILEPLVGADVRFEAVKCITHRKTISIHDALYHELGDALLAEENSEIALAAVRLLARSNNEADLARIRQIKENSDDHDLIELCDESLSIKGEL